MTANKTRKKWNIQRSVFSHPSNRKSRGGGSPVQLSPCRHVLPHTPFAPLTQSRTPILCDVPSISRRSGRVLTPVKDAIIRPLKVLPFCVTVAEAAAALLKGIAAVVMCVAWEVPGTGRAFRASEQGGRKGRNCTTETVIAMVVLSHAWVLGSL